MNGGKKAKREPITSPRALELHRLLIEAFGPGRVLLHTDYHLQVKRIGRDRDRHDVWLPDGDSAIKYRLADGKTTFRARVMSAVLDAIERDDTERGNHLQEETKRLVAVIDRAKSALRLEGPAAWFCDAGNSGRPGLWQCSAVYVEQTAHGSIVEVYSETLPAATSKDAERLAICLALERAAKRGGLAETCLIINDCRDLVTEMSDEFGDRIQWRRRNRNAIAHTASATSRQHFKETAS